MTTDEKIVKVARMWDKGLFTTDEFVGEVAILLALEEQDNA